MGDLAITHPPPSPTGKLDIILASYLRGLSSSPVSLFPSREVERGCKGGGGGIQGKRFSPRC